MSDKLNLKLAETTPNAKALMNLQGVDISEILEETYDQNELAKLNPEELDRLKKYIIKISFGSSAWISLICTGQTCVYRTSCALLKEGSALPPPVNKECPFERILAKRWFEEYKNSVKIDENDRVEVSQINDLVEIEIIKARVNAIIAVEGLIVENPIGTDPDSGEIIYRKEKHQAIEIKNICDSRKDKILKSLLATRESKMSALSEMGRSDPTQIYSNLKEKIRKIKEMNRVHEATNITKEIEKESENIVEL